MDFEVPPPPAKPASAKNAPVGDSKRNQQVATETKKTTTDPSLARVNGADQDERSPSASGKETIPGTSSFSTVPPKKRKAAGAANTAIVASGSGNTTANAAAQPTTKRPATSIPLANMSRESNMMTFEKSKGVLKKGGLVADDGTVLYVDGKNNLLSFFPRLVRLTNRLKIMCILSVSRLAILITSVGLWSSCTPILTIRNLPSNQFG